MTIEDIKSRLRRKSNRAIVGGFRPSECPFGSWFGRVLVSLPDEKWPIFLGKPMIPLIQINVDELPFRPENLADIALITVFIEQDELPINRPNGTGWLLRTYPTLEGLISIDQPNDQMDIKPFPILWELIEEDFPTWDYAADMNLPPEIDDNYSDLFQTQEGTKVGGWPFTIQSELSCKSVEEFVFQIDSEYKANWSWGDDGTGYFCRGASDDRNLWTLDWQCY